MFRILVAEDDDSARFLMCEVLRRAGYEPCPARDGVEALEVMEHYQCDLAVVDITMPRMDGITFTRTLREGNCDLPVLMVTARVTQEDKRRGFRAGTDDYMVKPVNVNELVLRIHALLRRAQMVADRRQSMGGTTFEFDTCTVRTGSTQLVLPQKEFLLLYKLVSSPAHIFTRQQLMDDIWGVDSQTDPRTVDVHINRLRDRFRDNPDFEIITVRGIGYKAVRK